MWYYIVIPYQLLLLIERLLFASFIFIQALAVVQTDRLLLFVIFIERLLACKFYCIFVLPEAVPRVRAAFAAAFIDGGRIEETPKLVQQGGRVPSRTAPCVSSPLGATALSHCTYWDSCPKRFKRNRPMFEGGLLEELFAGMPEAHEQELREDS